MADTGAITNLTKVVDRFLFKNKLTKNDFVNFYEHAADCVRELSIHDMPSYVEEEIAVSSLGIITMPSDMIDFISVGLLWGGELWTFTEKHFMVYTDFGGTDITKPTSHEYGSNGYAATGGKNKYYFKLDWKNRQIMIDGAEGVDVILWYKSSGLGGLGGVSVSVPVIMQAAIDAWLYYKKGELEDKSINELLRRDRNYEKQVTLLRNQSIPGVNEIYDYFLAMTTQSIQR